MTLAHKKDNKNDLKPKFVKNTRQTLDCSLCSFTCKSRPTLKNHTLSSHTTQVDVNTETYNESNKRQAKSFTCNTCQSIFDSNTKMKIHIKKQHESKETNSPERKAARTEVHNNCEINKDNEPAKDKEVLKERVEETITVLKGDFENLQDLLVQSGQDNEKLKIQMKETNEKASANAAIKKNSMELHDIITQQNHKMNLMEQESIKLLEEKKFFKEEAEKAVQATHRLNEYISTFFL